MGVGTKRVLAILILVGALIVGCGKKAKLAQNISINPDKITGSTGLLAIIGQTVEGSIDVVYSSGFQPLSGITYSGDIPNGTASLIVLLAYTEDLSGRESRLLQAGASTDGLTHVDPAGLYYARFANNSDLQSLTPGDPNEPLVREFAGMVYVVGDLGPTPTPTPTVTVTATPTPTVTPTPTATPILPDPAQSVVSGSVIINGGAFSSSAQPFVLDPLGSFSVVVRDSAGHLILGAVAQLDLTNCSYVRICKDPAVNLSCHPNGSPSRVITTTTALADDPDHFFTAGTAVFKIPGTLTAQHAGCPPPPTILTCAKLTINGVAFPDQVVSVLDLMANGVPPFDGTAYPSSYDAMAEISYAPTDLSYGYCPEADFNGDGTISNMSDGYDLADADLLWSRISSGHSYWTCNPVTPTYCEP
ncbi:MAG: hypothetical protein V1798_05055 [Pseudomonadota bacterium]